MSTQLRLAKGTGLTLAGVAIGIVGQIASVPIYLSRWDAQTYGVWLVMQGMLGYLSIFSTAYHQYTYAEVLKNGPRASDAVRTIYWSSLWVAYLIAAAEFGAVLTLAPQAVSAALEPAVPSGATDIAATVLHVLILYTVLNLITMPFGALTSRTMSIHGYYPVSAAWGLVRRALALIAPVAAVALGADLVTAGQVLIAAHALVALPSLVYWFNLAQRFGLLARQKVDWRMGFMNVLYSLPLAGQAFIDSLRQQGFRILLGAYVGATSVTALATTRTLANVLQQGLGTITGPLLPELMRYVVDRDQDRMEGAFAIVWLAVFTLLMPGILLLSMLAEPIFIFWTRGAVDFDPVLFVTLLAVVAVYASMQPATAILQGQNRVAWIVSASVAAALVLGALSLLLIQPFGLRGAGFALLGAELCALAVVVMGAVRSLEQSGLHFPLPSFALVVANTVAVIGLTLLNVTTFHSYVAFMALPVAVNLLFAVAYWVQIPTFAREKIVGVLSTLGIHLKGRSRMRSEP
jgi:O-antigen/teichoic acid export membrane protein